MKTLGILLIGLLAAARCQEEAAMNKCIQLALPLLSENHLVVPSTPAELQMVCDKWQVFVQCIKKYISARYSDAQESAFNGAVETAVRNVHRMCKEPRYRQEYLQHAPCIKKMTMEDDRCGIYYTNMARAVTEGISTDQEICCLHKKFRDCMSRQLPCDNTPARSSIGEFVETFLDNGLHVFVQKCRDYVFSSGHCAGPRQTRLDDRRPQELPTSALRPEHRATDWERPQARPRPEPRQPGTERPPARGPTTPYQGWFRPETTTSVWVPNALDDLAQAQRQDSGAPPAAGAALLLAAGLLAALAAR